MIVKDLLKIFKNIRQFQYPPRSRDNNIRNEGVIQHIGQLWPGTNYYHLYVSYKYDSEAEEDNESS